MGGGLYMDKKRIEAAVREILLAVGEDPDREGLVETPRRVADMYAEVFSGLEEDPHKHLKIFTESHHDEMVTVRDIPLYSMCEHHLMPLTGVAHIAYIPKDGKVIGLSKLARIVNCYARRPQLQERLTAQVADFLQKELEPQGVAVIIEAEHHVHDHARSESGRCADADLRAARADEIGCPHPRGSAVAAEKNEEKPGRRRKILPRPDFVLISG